jgi:hypothetical protein
MGIAEGMLCTSIAILESAGLSGRDALAFMDRCRGWGREHAKQLREAGGDAKIAAAAKAAAQR